MLTTDAWAQVASAAAVVVVVVVVIAVRGGWLSVGFLGAEHGAEEGHFFQSFFFVF